MKILLLVVVATIATSSFAVEFKNPKIKGAYGYADGFGYEETNYQIQYGNKRNV